MRVLLAGLGNWGAYWYGWLTENRPDYRVIVVEPGKPSVRLRRGDVRYTSVEAALEADEVDCLINATPPEAHTAINRLAFARGIPVLCEKPITLDYAEAVQVVGEAMAAGVMFMIAENYRRLPVMRAVRGMIGVAEIGEIASMRCDLYRDFRTDKPYWHALENPFLIDVVVHILDLFRYLSWSEGRTIYARSFNPAGSPHTGDGSLHLLMEMQNGVECSFAGSLATKGAETDWSGAWRIEGSRGVIRIDGGVLEIWQWGRVLKFSKFEGIGARHVFDEFETALLEGREPETSAADYLNTQALTHFAEESIRVGGVVKVRLP